MIRSDKLDELIEAGEAQQIELPSRTVVLEDGQRLMRCSKCGNGYEGYLHRVRGLPELCDSCGSSYLQNHGSDVLKVLLKDDYARIYVEGVPEEVTDFLVDKLFGSLFR